MKNIKSISFNWQTAIYMLLISVFISAGVANAQNTPKHVWSKQIYIPSQTAGIIGSEVIPLASKTDAAGNTYIVGAYRGSADINPDEAVSIVSSSNSGGSTATAYKETYLVKLNKYGEHVWSQRFQSAGQRENWPTGIDITATGKILVTGQFNGEITIGSTAINGGLSNGAPYCGYMAQFNPDGSLHSAVKLQGAVVYNLFSAAFFNTHINILTSKIDEDGNILLAGRITGDVGGNGVDIDPNPSFIVSYSVGESFIAKYDLNYNLISHKKLTVGNSNFTIQQIEAANDTIYIQGTSNSATLNFNGTSTPSIIPTNNGNFYTAAYTSDSLKCIWAFRQGSSVNKQRIRINPTGGLAYMCQINTPTFDIDPSSSTLLLNGGPSSSILLAHFNTSNGTIINSGPKMARRLSDTLINSSLILGDFDFTSAGSLFIAGNMSTLNNFNNNSIDMDPGPGVVNLSIGWNNQDFFIAKYNADFSINFAKLIINNQIYTELINSLNTIDTNTFVISAYNAGTNLTFDPDNDATTISTSGFNAGIYAKYTSGSSNMVVTKNAPDTIESCNFTATVSATSNNNNYTYQWYRNNVKLTNDTLATISKTVSGTYQCLVKNQITQQWSKKILFTQLVNLTIYHFYQLNGNTNHSTTVSYNGVGTAISYAANRNGMENNAAVFNGTTSEINVSGNILNPSVIANTYNGVSLWFKRASLTRRAMSLVGYQVTSNATWSPILYLDSTGRLCGGARTTGVNAVNSSAIIMDTAWHHAAWTYDPSRGKQIIFLDGVEVGSIASSALSLASGNIFKIGNGYLSTSLGNVSTTGNNQYFEGMIDEVRVTNTIKAANALQLANEIVVLGQTPLKNQSGIAQTCANSPVTATIFLANTDVSYSWLYSGTVVNANDTNFSGVNTSSFTIKNLPAGRLYNQYVDVTDKFCNVLFNYYFVIEGVTNSAITSQPVNQTACLGGSAMFVVKATVAKSYAWKKNGTLIANANNDTLILTNVTNNDFANYTCDVKSCNDSTITTNTASLSLLQAAITTQPASQTTCLGSSVILKTATNYPYATFQWRKNGVNIVSANQDSIILRMTDSSSFGAYTVAIGACASNLLSDTAILTQGVSTTSGNINNTNLVLRLPLSGNVTDLTGLNTTLAGGTISYVPGKNPVSTAADFNASSYVQVNHSANLIFTNTISISFWTKPKTHNDCRYIDKSAGNINNFFIDVNSGTLRVFVAGKSVVVSQLPAINSWTHITATYLASGSLKVYYDGVLMGSTAGGSTNLTSNTNSLLVGAIQGATCKVNSLMSDVRIFKRELSVSDITAIMNDAPVVNVISGVQTICTGANLVASVNAIPDAVYRWYKNGVLIPNATSAAYTKTNATISDSGTYSVDVFTENCVKQTVITGKITINVTPTITTQPANASACAGGNIALNVIANGIANTYSWFKNGVLLTNGGRVTGATSSTLGISTINSTDTASYRCVVTNACGVDSSNIAKVTLNSGLQITEEPTSKIGCTGGSIQFIVKTNDQNATYSWRYGGVTIANSNNDTLTLTNLTTFNAGYYQVFATSACGSDTSVMVNLSLITTTAITTQPIGKNICGSAGFTLTGAATGTGVTYQWKLNGVDIPNATTNTFTKAVTLATDSGNYTLVATGSCNSVTSAIARITLSAPIVVVNQPDSVVKVCAGTNVSLNISATGIIFRYQWFRNNAAIANGGTITGATSSQLAFNSNSLAAGNITCKIYGSCDTVTSQVVNYQTEAAPSFNGNLLSQTVCSGGNTQFTVGTNNAVSYRWLINGNPLANMQGIVAGATTDTLSLSNITAANFGVSSAIIRLELTGKCSTTLLSNNAQLTISDSVRITNQSISTINACEGNTLLIYVNTNSIATYVWKKNGTVLNNQTNDTLMINGLSAADDGTYTCTASGCGSTTSNNMVLTVNPSPTPTITQAANVLSTQAFSTYQWRKNGVAIGGANAQTYNATESGVYTVNVSNTSGCSNISVDYNFTYVGLNEIINFNNSISVYPNPANNNITIRVDAEVAEWDIKILNAAGAEVLSTNMIKETSLNISTLAQGIYLIRVYNKDGQQGLVRFVKD